MLTSFLPSHLPPPQTLLNRVTQYQRPTTTTGSLPFTMLFPPPNITGKLHMGHAFTVVIQDSAARFQRMRGREVRWIYGLDHAGIATHSVVSKRMAADTTNTNNLDASLQSWYASNQIEIRNQLINLGASLDYNHEYFTLDKARSDAVIEAFCRLFNRGLIYRANRMIHWCPRLQTALSDLEVNKEQIDQPTTINLFGENVTFGLADDLCFKLVGDEDTVLIARTTRLETLFGDVAICVHPHDPSKAKFIGRLVWHPIIPGKTLPVVSDETLVDRDVGTGVVKITPQHDEKDWECAKRLRLPQGPRVILDDGTMCPIHVPAPFAGLTRFQARELLRKTLHIVPQRHAMVLSRCSRSGDVLEPQLKPQFFVNMKDMATRALQAVRNGELTLLPPNPHMSLWENWLSECKDWCVSRQISWGHRIPAYRRMENMDEWVAAHDDDEARKLLGLTATDTLVQDNDVLDTWFSSALLPLSAQGWPSRTPPPLSLMETGSDILFFWVARMVMICGELDNRVPFHRIFLHGMVKDAHGRKMSKSLGNVIDPNDVIHGVTLPKMLDGLRTGNLPQSEIEASTRDMKAQFPQGIAECGVDALRLALASYANVSSPSICFDAQRAEQFRVFCNKIWQATRFVIGRRNKHGGGGGEKALVMMYDQVPLQHRWLSHRLRITCEECVEAFEMLDCERAVTATRKFLMNDVCDVFIEIVKVTGREEDVNVLDDALRCGVKLLHPIAPFVTEELWGYLIGGEESEVPLTYETFPDPMQWVKDDVANTRMELALDIVRAVRALKKKLAMPGPEPVMVYVDVGGDGTESMSDEVVNVAETLLRTATVVGNNGVGNAETLSEPLMVGLGGGKVFVARKSATTTTTHQRQNPANNNNARKIQDLNQEIDQLQARLSSIDFVSKAPSAVKEKTNARLAQLVKVVTQQSCIVAAQQSTELSCSQLLTIHCAKCLDYPSHVSVRKCACQCQNDHPDVFVKCAKCSTTTPTTVNDDIGIHDQRAPTTAPTSECQMDLVYEDCRACMVTSLTPDQRHDCLCTCQMNNSPLLDSCPFKCAAMGKATAVLRSSSST